MRPDSSGPSVQSQAAAPVQYKVYTQRWLVLATYALLSMMVAVLWISFAPIAKEVSKYLDDIGKSSDEFLGAMICAIVMTWRLNCDADPTGHTAVNMLAISFMILYPFGTIAGSYCTTKYGLRGTVLVGGTLAFLSGLIRYLAIVLFEDDAYSADVAYTILFIGQCFAGMAQPFFMNLPTMIADNWFSVEVNNHMHSLTEQRNVSVAHWLVSKYRREISLRQLRRCLTH